MKTIKNNLALFFVFLLLPLNVFSQVSLDWARTYDGPYSGSYDYDQINDVIEDASGNVYVTGRSQIAAYDYDITTIKYSADGTQLWVRSYDYNDLDDFGRYLALDPAGNIYVIGRVVIDTYNKDIIVIKYKPDGTLVWAKRMVPLGLTGNGIDFATGVAFDNDYIYIAATVTENSGGFRQIALIKTNFNAIYNSATYGTMELDDEPSGITLDASGNIYLCGFTTNPTTLFRDATTIKYNNSLEFQWVNKISDPSFAYSALHIKADNSGNVRISGSHWISYSPSGAENFTAKIKYNGITQWIRSYYAAGSYSNTSSGLTVDGSGNTIVVGNSWIPSTINQHAYILKYNSSGTLVWDTVYQDPSHQSQFNSVTSDIYGNFYITGYLLGGSTFKYNSVNDLKWVTTYPGGSGKIKLGSGNSVYVAGGQPGVPVGSGVDYLTLKYSQSSSSPVSSLINKDNKFALSDNYPNPFNPATSIKFSIPAQGNVVLKVYDNIGREVATLVNQNMEAGEHEAVFDGSNLASGVYFYKLISGEFTDVKKMILVK